MKKLPQIVYRLIANEFLKWLKWFRIERGTAEQVRWLTRMSVLINLSNVRKRSKWQVWL